MLIFASLFSAAFTVIGVEEAVINAVVVSPGTIVEGCAANVSVYVSGDGLEGKDVYAYLEVGDSEIAKTKVDANGKAVLKIAEAPVKGTYYVIAVVDGESTANSTTINVVSLPAKIWEISFDVTPEGKLCASFDASISESAKSGYKAWINGNSVAVTQISDAALALDVDAASLVDETVVKISGVKYPVLFPSYSFAFTQTYQYVEPEDTTLRLWYTAPPPAVSGKSWQYSVLPIGNGYMGGMVFGYISNERIHFNEKSMWTGGPTATRTPEIYNYGNRHTNVAVSELNEFRTLLDDKTNNVFGMTNGHTESSSRLMALIRGGESSAPYVGMGTYQDFGDIYLNFARSGLTNNAATNYMRYLDMNTATSGVSYDFDGVSYQREYLNSYPDNVLAMRLTASEPGKLTFDVSLTPYTSGKTGASNVAADDKITYRARFTDNSLNFEAQVKVINTGGELAANANGNGTISVTGADSVLILLACGTDYKNEYPNYRGVDPHDAITGRIAAASAKGWDAIKETHLNDYQPLFSRVSLNLEDQIPNIPTDELVVAYRNGEHNKALEEMAYQYGRYLAISTSREGCLPPNLVGVWQIGGAVWNGDYHFNENFQMNYWPMLASNLEECAEPLTGFMESLRVPGRVAAGASLGVPSAEGEANGFVIHTATNIFGLSAPYQSQEFGWNVGGVSWSLETVYDYYKYTGDTAYLREKIYPMLKEQATFYDKFLWWSDYQQRLVVGPSVSPEQGPTTNGTTYDQSVAWQAFNDAIEAAEILGVDADLRAVWADKKSKLNPVLIGAEGQVKEWFEETTIGRAKVGELNEIAIPNFNAGHAGVPHRHISHLVGLYPGTLINRDATPGYIEASKVSLEKRGLVATGWAKAHRINAWARTGDGEKTYEMVRSLVGGNYSGLMTNLLDSHGGYSSSQLNYTSYEWQIDGNFGFTAGINEMLVQSQLGYTEFLPAIPQAWDKGSVSGIVSRGNFVLDMDWSNGTADEFKVTSRVGGKFTGRYPMISGTTVTDASGVSVTVTKLDDNTISFDTVKDGVYTISFGA